MSQLRKIKRASSIAKAKLAKKDAIEKFRKKKKLQAVTAMALSRVRR
jgi:hypothetical protein